MELHLNIIRPTLIGWLDLGLPTSAHYT